MPEVELTLTGQGGSLTWIVCDDETLTVKVDGVETAIITRAGMALVADLEEEPHAQG